MITDTFTRNQKSPIMAAFTIGMARMPPIATKITTTPSSTFCCSYAGDASLNSASDMSTSLTVNKRALNVAASNDTKTYGQTKSYGIGSTAFIAGGLQNSETIGSVTISASGGTMATDSVSTYSLTSSAATG